MCRKILLLIFSLVVCHYHTNAQSLQLFQLDPANEWLGSYFYFNPVMLAQNQIVHSYLNNQHYATTQHTFGDVKINTYSTAGVLLEQETSLADSLFITKTILKAGGEKIVLGNAYRHMALYDTDTTLGADPEGEFHSFVLHLNASNHTMHYAAFSAISDMALDEGTNILYLLEQYAYDSARVYAYNLTTGNATIITTITQARVNARIIKTADYIYIAGASIEFGVEINGHHEPSEFPYITFVIQLNNDGSFNWIKMIEDVTTPQMGLAAAPEQGVYMCAELLIPLNIGDDTLEGPGWGGDFFLTRIDTNGHFLWAAEAPNNLPGGYNIGPGYCIDSDGDFNVFLAGSLRGLLQWDDGLTIGRDTNVNIPTVLMYNKNGLVINHVIAAAGEQGSFYSIDAEPNGDFVVNGRMYDFLTFDGITQTITDGGYHPYFLYYTSNSSTVGELPQNHPGFVMYPNPLTGHAVLHIQRENAGISRLEIISLSGQKMLEQQIAGKTTAISLKGLSPGMYFVRVNGEPVQKLLVD